jgi:TPR repeat protein
MTESLMSKIMRRGSFAFICLLTLSLAACDNTSDRPQTESTTPATEVASMPPTMPRQQAPTPAAPAVDQAFVKPAGVNPGKLAEHAKGLEELGYLAEAVKLYSHACNWGHAVSCGRLADLNRRLAQQDAAPLPIPAPAPAPTPSDKPEIMATAPSSREVSRPAAKPAVASAAVKTAANTSAGSTSASQPGPRPGSTSNALLPPVVAQPSAPTVAAPAQAMTASPAPLQAPALPAAADEPVQLASQPLQATAKPPASQERKPAVDPQKLSQQAERLEHIGYTATAIKLYKDACLAGYGPACKRLGEIYIKGSQDVARDYAESVRWYEQARHYGMAVPNLEKRTFVR